MTASDNKVGVILQARMGSSRLPGKVLKPFGQTVLLRWILDRMASSPWPVVVATSSEEQDTAIAEYCMQWHQPCWRGSEMDVLDRYYTCAIHYGFEHVIRLTGDNPFPDVQELERLCEFHLQGDHDYSHNIGQLPIGVGAEIFRVQALERSWREGSEPQHREHVNEYILERPSQFSIGIVKAPAAKHAPALSLTIDTEQDYQRISRLPGDAIDTSITTEALIERCSSSV